MTVKVAINGFGRIGRLVARAILEQQGRDGAALDLVAINDLADAKSNAWLFSRDSVHGRYPGEVSAGRQRFGGRRQAHPRHRRTRSSKPAAQGARRRPRARMHGVLHRPGQLPQAHRCRREEGADLGARQGRRPDGGLRRQPRQADGGSRDRLQCVVHDQLPRARRQGAQRFDRDRARADDDGPRLYQRSEDSRPDPPRLGAGRALPRCR